MESVMASITSRKSYKLSDQVYDALCEKIIAGELEPDQRLREAEVASDLGVSRTPIREAFAVLERQRLLCQDAKGAYFVNKWDKQILWEIATLRGALEGLAISLACGKFSTQDFDNLDLIILQMDAALRREDHQQLIALDIQFHNYIWRLCGHELLRQALEDMRAQVLYFMVITRPGDELDYPASHREIVEIIKASDPSKAKESIEQHILDTAKRSIARLKLDNQTE